jgi:hypothetical protein
MNFNSFYNTNLILESMNTPAEFFMTDDSHMPFNMTARFEVKGKSYYISLDQSKDSNKVYILSAGGLQTGSNTKRPWKIRPNAGPMVMSTIFAFIQSIIPILSQKIDGFILEWGEAKIVADRKRIVNLLVKRTIFKRYKLVEDTTSTKLYIVKKNLDPIKVFPDLASLEKAKTKKMVKKKVSNNPSIKYSFGTKDIDLELDDGIISDMAKNIQTGGFVNKIAAIAPEPVVAVDPAIAAEETKIKAAKEKLKKVEIELDANYELLKDAYEVKEVSLAKLTAAKAEMSNFDLLYKLDNLDLFADTFLSFVKEEFPVLYTKLFDDIKSDNDESKNFAKLYGYFGSSWVKQNIPASMPADGDIYWSSTLSEKIWVTRRFLLGSVGPFFVSPKEPSTQNIMRKIIERITSNSHDEDAYSGPTVDKDTDKKIAAASAKVIAAEKVYANDLATHSQFDQKEDDLHALKTKLAKDTKKKKTKTVVSVKKVEPTVPIKDLVSEIFDSSMYDINSAFDNDIEFNTGSIIASENGDSKVLKYKAIENITESVNALDSKIKMAISSYTGDMYKQINHPMRSFYSDSAKYKAKDATHWLKNIKALNTSLDYNIRILQGFAQIEPSTSSIYLWRNCYLDGSTEYKPGDQIIDPVVLSTTITSKMTMGYGGTKLRILVPKGSKLMPVESVSKNKSEEEVLLAPASILTVTRVVELSGKESPTGTNRVFLDLLYEGSAARSYIQNIIDDVKQAVIDLGDDVNKIDDIEWDLGQLEEAQKKINEIEKLTENMMNNDDKTELFESKKSEKDERNEGKWRDFAAKSDSDMLVKKLKSGVMSKDVKDKKDK